VSTAVTAADVVVVTVAVTSEVTALANVAKHVGNLCGKECCGGSGFFADHALSLR